jgi:hypothetical protein
MQGPEVTQLPDLPTYRDIKEQAREIYSRLMSKPRNQKIERAHEERVRAFFQNLTPAQIELFQREMALDSRRMEIEHEQSYRVGIISGVFGAIFSLNENLLKFSGLDEYLSSEMSNDGEYRACVDAYLIVEKDLHDTLIPEQKVEHRETADQYNDCYRTMERIGRYVGRCLAKEMDLPNLAFLLKE